ncbi:hypothetical protein DM02DRAFT_614071 [Periconia macrospinosa]|uniref:Uncharacterized protein n=1 Tax=Periconia macrospinosa TaxID=97972 RepID=A0A2V1DRM6_9PLEO|nr:hypothetical protein DM02DRAFT_614071 [Periconia macrospinosa]
MQITIQNFAVIAALLTAASAAPNLVGRDVKVLPGTTDQGQSTPGSKRSAVTFEKRGPTDYFGDFTGQKSSHPDGSGTYVKSADVFHYGKWQMYGDKCWTDLFYVSAEQKETGWEPDSSLNCATTSECQLGVDHGVQTCTESSVTFSAGVSADILKGFLGVSAGVETTNTNSKCIDVSTNVLCTWNDNECHKLFISKTVKVNHGYIRRRCNKGHGDETVWSKDVDITEPATALHLGCNAFCNATSYST